MTRSEKIMATKRRNKETRERLARIKAETQAIVATGTCQKCQSKLVRNSAITGWYQCEQYGTIGFRARDTDPCCSWQGFV